MTQPAKIPIASAGTASGSFNDLGFAVANGYVMLQLAAPGGSLTGGGQVAALPAFKVSLDANGIPLAGQTTWISSQFASPVNPVFRMRLHNANDLMVQDFQNVILSGNPVDLTALVTSSNGVSYSGAVLLSPSGSQVIASGNLTLTSGSFIETAAAATGTGGLVRDISPALATPNIGVATATTVEGLTGQLTPNAAGGIDVGTAALPFSGIRIGAAGTNNIRLTGTATGSRVLTLPDATDTLIGRATNENLTNKDLVVASSGNNVTLLNIQRDASAIVGNGGVQNIYTYTLPANTMQAGKGIRIKAWSQHSTGSASVAYAVTFGGTAIQSWSSTSTASMFVEEYVFNNPGLTNAQTTAGYETDGNVQSQTVANAAAISTTSSVVINYTFNVANTDQVTPKLFVVELIQ